MLRMYLMNIKHCNSFLSVYSEEEQTSSSVGVLSPICDPQPPSISIVGRARFAPSPLCGLPFLRIRWFVEEHEHCSSSRREKHFKLFELQEETIHLYIPHTRTYILYGGFRQTCKCLMVASGIITSGQHDSPAVKMNIES